MGMTEKKVWVLRDLANGQGDTYIWVYSRKEDALNRYNLHAKNPRFADLSKPRLWPAKRVQDHYIRSVDAYYQKVGRCQSCGKKSEEVAYSAFTLTIGNKTIEYFGVCPKCAKNIVETLKKSEAVRGLKILRWKS
jgi:hypothetical protein